jgi:hypothetical protein
MIGLILASLLGCGSVGQEPFDAGLSALRTGDSTNAVSSFTEALAQGAQDPAVYHGLGNSLYRLGKVGPAMAAWRRGLALAPRNGDIAANMDLARKGLKDRLEPPTTHRGVFFWQSALSPLESGAFAAVAIALGLWIMVVGRMQAFRRPRPLSSAARWTAAVSGILGMLVALSTADALNQRQGAVIVSPGVEVRSALGPSGVSLFVLHEGAEVSISDATDTHKLISLVDGRKGWVTSRALLSTDPSAPFVLAR